MISLEVSFSRLTKLIAKTFRGSFRYRRQSPGVPSSSLVGLMRASNWSAASVSVSPIDFPPLVRRRAPGWLSWLSVVLWLSGEAIGPPPKESAADQCQQNDSDDRHANDPTNRKANHQNKHCQQNDAPDD